MTVRPAVHVEQHSAAAMSEMQEIAAFFDEFAREEDRWRRRNRTYHRLVERVHRFLIPSGAAILEIGSGSGDLLAALEPSYGLGIDVSAGMVEVARRRHPHLDFRTEAGERFAAERTFDYVVLSDLVPFAHDLLAVFRNVAAACHPRTRVVIHSYNHFWRPVIRIAEALGLKRRKPIRNWVSASDIRNLLQLADFEVITVTPRIIFPKWLPLVSTLLNGVVATLPVFRWFCLTYWVVARPRAAPAASASVSVVVPCRNEAGSIAQIVERVPDMGSETEIIFVEGGSTDDTRAEIERQIAAHPERRLSLYVQSGRGKGDAVRLGFEHAAGDVLMILDGDLTVAPEDLRWFYDAIVSRRAEFVNGSRLVYDLEPGAMQLLNVLGNRFFSAVFTFLIGQPVKDTLCGTKVLWRRDYDDIARGRAEFGALDPFGDFDLLLGAARLGLRIVDLPVRYRARSYGRTNIVRFRHGLLLLRMAVRGFARLKVSPVRV